FVNYPGNHSRNPSDAYSTVPTGAERAGDLAIFNRAVVDPATGLPFADNQVPASRINPAAHSLLNLFPLPNQPGDLQNFHTVTTTTTDLDDVNVRFVHAFGAAAQQGRGGGRGGGGGGRGGGRGAAGRPGAADPNVTVPYRRSDS